MRWYRGCDPCSVAHLLLDCFEPVLLLSFRGMRSSDFFKHAASGRKRSIVSKLRNHEPSRANRKKQRKTCAAYLHGAELRQTIGPRSFLSYAERRQTWTTAVLRLRNSKETRAARREKRRICDADLYGDELRQDITPRPVLC